MQIIEDIEENENEWIVLYDKIIYHIAKSPDMIHTTVTWEYWFHAQTHKTFSEFELTQEQIDPLILKYGNCTDNPVFNIINNFIPLDALTEFVDPFGVTRIAPPHVEE